MLNNLNFMNLQAGFSNCPHGCLVAVSEVHLFWKCQVAKVLWFAFPWSIRSNFMQSEEILDFLNCLRCLDKYLTVSMTENTNFFQFATIILEHLWSVRNARIHNEIFFYLSFSLQTIRSRFGKAVNLTPMFPYRVATRGFYPSNCSRRIPNNCITLNCDAPVSNGAA